MALGRAEPSFCRCRLKVRSCTNPVTDLDLMTTYVTEWTTSCIATFAAETLHRRTAIVAEWPSETIIAVKSKSG